LTHNNLKELNESYRLVTGVHPYSILKQIFDGNKSSSKNRRALLKKRWIMS